MRALHWDQPPDRLSKAFADLDVQLSRSGPGSAVLLVANGLWYQRGDPLRQAFLEAARGDYRAEVSGADFIGNPSAALDEINHWVGLKTFGKIARVLPPDGCDAATRLALVNAVYFKGQWEHPFRANATVAAPFFIRAGASVNAPLMTEREQLKEVSNPDCDLLELPYRGGDLSMVVLLPRARDGLAALERNLSFSQLIEWLAAVDFSPPKEIHVTLPRFEITYGVELTETLKALGVAAAFDRYRADFSAMDGKRDLYASAVFPRAYVGVNEQGTEAAAAAAWAMTSLGIEQSQEFKADHPFLFLVRDNQDGSVLFLGRMVDPRSR